MTRPGVAAAIDSALFDTLITRFGATFGHDDARGAHGRWPTPRPRRAATTWCWPMARPRRKTSPA